MSLIYFSLTFLSISLSSCSAQGRSSVDLGETEVSSMVLAHFCDLEDSCAPIFEHVKNPVWEQSRKRYYVFPQFRVDKESLSWSSVSNFNKHFVEFNVQMFDQCYLQQVAAYLTTVVGNVVNAFQVAPYSLHQVRLNWADAPDPNSGIKMTQSPIPQTAQSPKIQIRIYTDSEETAKDLEGSLKSEPKLFDFFRLEYSLSAAGTAKQLLTIPTESASQTAFFAKIQNRFGQSNSVYLSSEDLGRLTQETFQNVVAAQFKDVDFLVSADNRLLIQDLIREAMVTDRVIISSADDKRWKSVFWNEDWARPDYLTNFLNQKFQYDAGDSKNFSFFNEDLRDYLEKHNSDTESSDLKLGFLKFSFGGSSSGSSSSSSKSESNQKQTIAEDEMLSWLHQNHNNIQWTGRQFQLKPMELSRVNLQKLQSDTNLTVTSIQSRLVRVDGKAKIRLQGPDQKSCSEVAEAWDQQLGKLNQEQTSLQSQIHGLSQKTIALESRSTSLKNRLNLLNRETGPLRHAEFCVWKKGPCPVGFAAVEIYQGGIKIISVNSKSGLIGDSYMRLQYHHGQSNIDLVFNACCK